MAIIDVITYNGEEDLFDLRYNILKDRVDQFIVVEATKTFSGKPKPLYFNLIKDNYPGVKYHIIDDYDDQAVWEMAKKSPNTVGADHWKLEFYIKEKIKDTLQHLSDDDIVFIGDCDEIWNPDAPVLIPMAIKAGKLKLLVYVYYLNNRSTELFYGTLVGRYKDIKGEYLNHLRMSKGYVTDFYGGWHFTSLKDGLKRKLEDSYTRETYANDWVMSNLEGNIQNNKDFLGRDFHYTVDETQWPQYLKDNKEKYKHLCK